MSALFLRKSARHQKTYSTQTTSRHYDKKNPERAIFEFFFHKTSTNNQSNFKTRSSSSLFQLARGSGATTRWMYFFQKSTHHSKIPRSATRFHSRKHLDVICSYSTRPEGAKRVFQSSTMKCLGACRCGTHRIPHKEERRSSLTRILPM